MIFNRIIIWSIVFTWSFSSCKAYQENELNMLIVKDFQIIEVLNKIVKEESEYGGIENHLLIVRVEKKKSSYEIRIGSFSKNSMSSYLTGKKDKPLGFFEYEGITVVVFGLKERLFFEKTNNTKGFPFLEAKPKMKVEEGKIPPPPVIYEPIVWIYMYENEKLQFIDKGRFSLLI